MAGPQRNYYDTLTAAINDLVAHGFDSMARVEFWSGEIRKAAERTMAPLPIMEQMLRDALTSVYSKLVDRGEIARYTPGISRFTLEKVRPQMRAELDRRIMASANLIKLNRTAAIEKTLQRFQGWSTSIPAGGTRTAEKMETKADLKKALARLPFEERRVLIDQGHKLRASVSEIVATDGKALAGVWRSHWRQAGYDYRVDHKERDMQVYLLRGSWALEAGLIKPGPAGYYDKVTAVGEEPFCRCYMVWLFNLRDLPEEMLTNKGREKLAAARKALAS